MVEKEKEEKNWLILHNNEEQNKQDKINHPSHYTSGNIEVIDYIEDLGFGTGFCLGNAIKYISRAGRKSGESGEDDIKKAIWYLNRYLSKFTDKNN